MVMAKATTLGVLMVQRLACTTSPIKDMACLRRHLTIILHLKQLEASVNRLFMGVIALLVEVLGIMAVLGRNLLRLPNPWEVVDHLVACKMLLLVVPPIKVKVSIMANSKLVEMT
jgi:hypothetical protein